MSNLTTEVFGDMNYLYEHIANRDAQQLNENSDYYDEEATELVADILATISSSMVYEGYSANGIVSFLANSPNEDIIEKYLNFDENILTESTVSEDYIVEQLEIFDFAINEGLVGGAIKLLGRIASKPARMKAAERLATSSNPARTAAAYQKLANKNIAKAGFKPASTDGAPASFKFKNTDTAARAASMSKPIAKVKDLAKGAKAVLTSPTARNVGLTALGAGALVGLPYAGAKLAGAGSGGQGPSPTGGKATNASNADFTKGSALAKLGGREGRIKDGEFRTMGWSQQSKDRYNQAKGSATPPPAPKLPAPTGSGGGSGSGGGGKPAAKPPAKPKVADKAPAGETAMQKWARANPKLADRVKPGQSGYDEISATRTKPGPNEKQNQTPTTGPTPAIPDLKSVNADLKKANTPDALNKPAPAGSALAAEQERRKAQAAATQKESYDAYELVLEYLFDYGHADTIEEAEYLMTELDESFIQSLVETYHANLLAEEVEEWVNELVEEGYDLSEYTWDDMVDYYFT